MLISLSCSNFKSIKNTQTISFDAVNDSRLDDKRLYKVNEKYSLLKTLAIIGANGAGKSSIIRALEVVKAVVTSASAEDDPLKHLVNCNFAYGTNKNLPSVISVDFLTEGGEICRYVLVADSKYIHKETLYRTEDGFKKMVFSIRRESFEVDCEVEQKAEDGSVKKVPGKKTKYCYHCSWGKNFEKFVPEDFERRSLTRKLKSNKSLLQRGSELGIPLFKDAASWFKDVLDIKPLGFAQGSEKFLADMITEHPDWAKKVVEFLWACDITDIRDIKVQNGHPLFVHTNATQKYASYFSGESLSLRRLSTIAVSYFEAYTRNKTMFFDDFGMMLHPNVVQHAVKLFETAGDGKKSQLIVIDCNPSLLKNDLVRRDGIYFAEKINSNKLLTKKEQEELNRGGSREEAYYTTHYYSLANFRYSLKKLNNIQDYTNGAFGSLPIMSDFKFDK